MNFLPVFNNMFNKTQTYIVRWLQSRDDLKVWEGSGRPQGYEKDWAVVDPEVYQKQCGYYCMVGISPGEWAYLPSFEKKIFRLNGAWYTVEWQTRVETTGWGEEYDYRGCFLVPLLNGDEAELTAERFGFQF